jgi:hypothetical protein
MKLLIMCLLVVTFFKLIKKLRISFLFLRPHCVAGVNYNHAPRSLHGRELDGSPQTVRCGTTQARVSAPRGTVERAGGAGQGDHALSLERLQGPNSRPATAPTRMRHGHRRYVMNNYHPQMFLNNQGS